MNQTAASSNCQRDIAGGPSSKLYLATDRSNVPPSGNTTALLAVVAP